MREQKDFVMLVIFTCEIEPVSDNSHLKNSLENQRLKSVWTNHQRMCRHWFASPQNLQQQQQPPQ